MERAENSNLGEWLRGSPAFQKALQDLHGSVRMPDVHPNAWGLDRVFKLDKLPLPDASTLDRLGRYKPNLPHIDPPALPSLGRASLPPVSAPSPPSMSSLGTLASWLLCLALIGLFVWQASRWIKLPGRAELLRIFRGQFGRVLGIHDKTMREVRRQLAPRLARRGGAPMHRR